MYEKVDINKSFEYQATKFQLSYFPKEHNTAGIICTSTEVFNVYRISLIIYSLCKSLHIRSYSGPHFSAFGLDTYSVRMRENADQNNAEYRHF